MLTTWLNWLDANAGAIQGLGTIVLVVVTGILVWVTWTYAKAAKQQAEQAAKQVTEMQQQRFDQQRPVLHPSGDPPLTQDRNVDWWNTQTGCPILLRNVGSGVALIVCGVLFPPQPESPPKTLPPRYTVWRESPLLPAAERSLKLEVGKTKMNGDATIDGHSLFAPRKPTQQEMMIEGRYNVLARLTRTA
jgi:hypothetical protein